MKLRCMVAGLMMVAMGVVAQDVRVYVDLSKVFDGFYKTIAANLSFENRKQEVEDQHDLIKRELETLNTDARKHDADMRNELLAKDARESAARKLQACVERLRAKTREYESVRNSNYQMLRRIEQERKDELVKDILKIVDAVANDMKATEVIEVSGRTLNNVGVFLRYPKDKEITDEVLKRLNVGHETELKTAKEELERRRTKAEAAKPVPEIK